MNKQAAKKLKRRGVYLLPNLITTAGLFAGFYAIVAATQGKFEVAAIAVFVAMVLDGLDGRVARLTNTQSEFGAQYDSLADMASFGLAPSLVMYEWSLQSLVNYGWHWGKLGWLGAFIYMACAALRLARFNTKASSTNKQVFQGLPSPAAAGVLVGFVWVFQAQSISGENLGPLALIVTTLTGLLMVSNVSYNSFKDVDFHNRVPFMALLGAVLVLALASIDPPKVLFTFFLIYAFSGPLVSVFRKLRKRNQRITSNEPPDE